MINRLSRSSAIEYLVGLDCDEKVLEKAEMVTDVFYIECTARTHAG